MRIAHVFPSSSWGGAEMYAVQLAKAQQDRGIDTVIWGSEGARLVEEARLAGVATLTEPVARRADLLSLPRLINYLKKSGITHLHLHWTGGVWAFAGIKRFLPIKIILHLHMWVSHSKRDPLHWTIYSGVDRVIVAGARQEALARQMLPVRRSRISVVPYAMDFAEAKSVVSDRRHWGIPKEAFVFGVFARLDFQKGQCEFLDALRAAQQTNDRIYGLIVGDPTAGEEASETYANEIRRRVTKWEFPERIKLLPFQKRFLDVLACTDVLVAPSYHECYALIFLNAFSLGKPAVGTDSGGTPDLVRPGQTGWLVPAKDSENLARVMREVADNPTEVLRRGGIAQDLVLSKHSWDQVISQWRVLYS